MATYSSADEDAVSWLTSLMVHNMHTSRKITETENAVFNPTDTN